MAELRDGQTGRHCPTWCAGCDVDRDQASGAVVNTVHMSEVVALPYITDQPHTLRVQLDQMNGDAPSLAHWIDRGEQMILLPPSVARELAGVLLRMADAAEDDAPRRCDVAAW